MGFFKKTKVQVKNNFRFAKKSAAKNAKMVGEKNEMRKKASENFVDYILRP